VTLEDVLQELIQVLSSKGDGTISWEQVRQWPESTIEIFQDAGWIKPKSPAKRVVCSGCEENCTMPVHVYPPVQNRPAKAFVACDKFDYIGRIPISLDCLQLWQITEKQVAGWIARTLGLRGEPKRNKGTKNFLIGNVQGKKKTVSLELVCTELASLKTSGHSLPLIEAIYFTDGQLQIDQEAIINLIDRPPPSDRYNPSIAKREARKLDTQARHKGLQRAYRELKRKHPEQSDNWCALQISRKPIGQGFSSETIRKNMKK
jgi:hypothetical protein